MKLCDCCGGLIEGGVCHYCGMSQDSPGEAGYVPEIIDGGFSALRDGDFDGAERYFDRVLMVDHKNGRAILGQLMAVAEAHTESELAEILKEGGQKDDENFTELLVKTLELAPGEMNEVFSGEYYDAKALMRAGKYGEALRIFRAIKDYHSGAPDMAEECLRRLAFAIAEELRASLQAQDDNADVAPEILTLRQEFRTMIDRYIEAVGSNDDEYVFTVNASHLLRYMKLLYSDDLFADDVRKLKLLNDARAILRMSGEFLERNEPVTQDSIPAMNENVPATQNDSLPTINDNSTITQDDSALTTDNATVITIQDDSIPAMNDNTAPTENDSQPANDDHKIPTWLKIALITAALIALALTLPQILSLIASLL